MIGKKGQFKNQLREDLARIIGLNPTQLTDQSALGSTPGWDSLKHMELMLVVEKKYGVALTPENVVQMMTFAGICEVIRHSHPAIGAISSLGETDFIDALRLVGLQPGDHVFVQSSVGTFGPVTDLLETIKRAFFSVIGSAGTLAVPAFNFGFMRGETFDVANTGSEGGIFSEYIRRQPGAYRSHHPPFHSVAAIGRHAAALAGVEAASSFSRDSVFGKMYDLDFKVCMFGTSLKHNTFFHYVEEQAGVPYRFYKRFEGQVKWQSHIETRTYRYYARYLEPAIGNDFHGVGEKLLAEFEGKKTTVGAGPIYLASVRKLVDVTMAHLIQTPALLVADRDKPKLQDIANGRVKS